MDGWTEGSSIVLEERKGKEGKKKNTIPLGERAQAIHVDPSKKPVRSVCNPRLTMNCVAMNINRQVEPYISWHGDIIIAT